MRGGSILSSVPCLKPLHIIAHPSPLTPHYTLTITHPSSLTPQSLTLSHSPLATHSSSLTPCHSPLFTHPSSLILHPSSYTPHTVALPSLHFQQKCAFSLISKVFFVSEKIYFNFCEIFTKFIWNFAKILRLRFGFSRNFVKISCFVKFLKCCFAATLEDGEIQNGEENYSHY